MRSGVFFLLPAALVIFSLKTAYPQSDAIKQSDRLLAAVSWYQNAAEMNALYYQGFNIARQRLDEAIKGNNQKPLAVIVDIDETMLDNSPVESLMIEQGDNRNVWTDWTEMAAAKPLPGALEFANYARDHQTEIFYITNRDIDERASTLKNLSAAGFPFADEEHLLTRGDTSYAMGNTSSKEGRRKKVSMTHEIVLLMGDNLNDFAVEFEDRSINNGKAAVYADRELFGGKFIVLPNPMYGAWEKPVFDYRSGLNESQKAEKMRAKLVKP